MPKIKKDKNKNNNKKIMDYIQNRLDIGNVKFKQEMPIGKFTLNDALEECTDLSLYLTSIILGIQKGEYVKTYGFNRPKKYRRSSLLYKAMRVLTSSRLRNLAMTIFFVGMIIWAISIVTS